MKGSKLRFLVYLSLVITLSGTQAVRAQALVAGSFQEQAQPQPSPSPEQTPQPSSEEAERAEIDAALNYVPVERIEKIKAFLRRASELDYESAGRRVAGLAARRFRRRKITRGRYQRVRSNSFVWPWRKRPRR